MKNFERLDPSYGFGVAHDALEHQTAMLGMDAEMKAFGSILYGRWNREGKALTGPLADDVKGFLVDGAEWPTRCHRYTSLEDESEWYEETLSNFSAELFRMIRAEDSLAHRYEAPWMLGQQIKDMCEWIRRGFRQTARVWAPHYGHDAFVSAFDDITREVDRIGSADHGDRLRVRIDACGGIQIRHTDARGYEY